MNKERILQRGVSAAQRLVLALVEKFEYTSWTDYDDDIDALWVLLEEANDELKPKLEQLARRQEE